MTDPDRFSMDIATAVVRLRYALASINAGDLRRIDLIFDDPGVARDVNFILGNACRSMNTVTCDPRSDGTLIHGIEVGAKARDDG